MSLIFLDSNILLYRRDPRDATKQRIAFSWLAALGRQRTGRLSWQVLQEFYVNAIQKLIPLGMTTDLARLDVRWLAEWNPPSPSLPIFETAWQVQDRYALPWWDAMVVATALNQECTLMLSEDMQHGLVINDRLTLINPFAEDAPAPPAA